MTPQSHAQQLLDSLYRKVLRRRLGSRPRMEALPRRVLWSAAPLIGADEIVFIDSATPDLQTLVADLSSRRGEVHILDASRSGISQIASTLQGREGIAAIHIVSHGSSGAIRLGDEWLTREQLSAQRQELSCWGDALSVDADILIYGCSVAAGVDGEHLLRGLSRLTGADVAASTNPTGNPQLGADWRLEAGTGTIEANVAFSTELQHRWSNTLGVAVDAVSTGSTKDQASLTISHTTAGTDRLLLVSVAIDPHGSFASSVNYGGVDLALVGARENSGTHSRVELWALVAPSTGTHNLTVNMNDTGFNGMVVGVISFTGVNQTTPLANFASSAGDSTTAALTVQSQPNDLVFTTVHSHNGVSSTPGAGLTEHWDLANDQSNGIGTTAAGAASVNNTWTVNNDDWSAVGVSVQAATVVTPVANTAPVNTVPAAQGGTEDVPLVFSTTNGNAISISDADAGSSAVQVTLSVTSGALTLASTTGLTFTTGDGTADATLVFTGSVAALNNALDGLSFAKPANVAGAATLTITTNDLGNTGAGGALSDSDTVAITLTAVNDAPSLTLPGAQATAEDMPLRFDISGGNAIIASDVDAGTQFVRMSLSVTSGTLTLGSQAGLTFITGIGAADAAVVFQGELSAINAALDGLTFVPAADFSGAVTLSATFNDLGSSGIGGALSDSGSLTINVSAVNDAPVNTLPPSQSVLAGGVLNLGSAHSATLAIADVDAGANPVEFTLNASAGTLTLATTAGLSFTTGDGSDDSTMTFRGTVAAINNALDGMSYNAPIILLGNAAIDITTNDLGNSAAGAAVALIVDG